jgi:exopolysaccharide biosynthesis polyprenyl glycosylphosphotransferase
MADLPSPLLRLRTAEHRILLLIGDLLAASASVALAIYTWYRYQRYVLLASGIPPRRVELLLNVEVPWWFYLLPLLWALLLVELYDPQKAASARRTFRGIALAVLIALLAYATLFLFYKNPNELPRVGVGAFLIYSAILTLFWRLLYIRIYATQGALRRVLIVGAGKAGQTLLKAYSQVAAPPFQLVGFIDDDPAKIGQEIDGLQVLGSSRDLPSIVEQQRISEIIVAITGEMRGETFQTLLDLQEQGIEVTRMPTVYEELLGRVPVQHLESDWLIRSFVDEARVSSFYEMGKRLLDLIGGLLGMVIFLILWPFVALAIYLESGRPILFAQQRAGRGGKPFTMYKFRTMVPDAEADGQPRLASENDPRVTRVGAFLRRTRLDEFPQFYNILRGEMSLVGPRAERPELVARFQKQIPFYRARLLVKPGLTGWAQINYGYASTVEETRVKLEYDLYYIKHRSMLMDLVILLRTVGTIFGLRGR